MAITFYEAVADGVPGVQIELNLNASGGLVNSQDYRNIYILSERVAAGTSAANEVTDTPFASEDDAVAWFGANSPGAMAASYIFNHREPEIKKAKCLIYGAAVAELVGGTAATMVQTFATTATASGTWIFKVGGHAFSVPVASGDDVTAQALACTNAYLQLPKHKRTIFTPVPNVGVVTWTASVKAEHGNSVSFVVAQDPGVTTTCSFATAAPVNGAGVPVMTTVLANLLPVQTPVIVVPWYDATTLGSIRDHVNTKSAAPSQLCASMICACDANATTLASNVATLDTNNCERVCYVGLYDTGTSSIEMAAKQAACQGAEPHLARSLDNLALMEVEAPAVSNGFTRTQLRTLIAGGVTPLYVPVGDDTVRICRAVSARSDLGVMDFALMTTLDYCRDRLSAVLSGKFRRMSIVDDDEPISAGHVTTVSIVRAALKMECLALGVEGYLTDVEENWENVVSDFDKDSGVLSMLIPSTVLPQWHTTMLRMDVTV
jgi:phage tail sheath gpL-like